MKDKLSEFNEKIFIPALVDSLFTPSPWVAKMMELNESRREFPWPFLEKMEGSIQPTLKRMGIPRGPQAKP